MNENNVIDHDDNATEAMMFALSYHQQRIYFIDEFETGNVYQTHPVYHNLPLITKIAGEVNHDALQQALNWVVERHEIMRTQVLKDEQGLQQHINDDLNVTLQQQTLPQLDEAQIIEHCIRFADNTFSLFDDALIRACCYQGQDNISYLVIVCNHFIADRQTLKIIHQELWHGYEAYKTGQAPSLEEPELHYVDFSEWQQELPAEELDKLFVHWQYQLRNKPKALELPTDLPRPGMHVFERAMERSELSAELISQLKALCQQYKVSIDGAFAAAFALLLERYSDQQDVYFGTSFDQREADLVDSHMGPISNLVVMQAQVEPMSLLELIEQQSQEYTRAKDHSGISFDLLVKRLKPEKDMSRTALFDVLLTIDNQGYHATNNVEVIETNHGYGKYDLHLLLQNNSQTGGYQLVLVYNKTLYFPYFAKQMSQHLLRIIKAMVADVNQSTQALELLGSDEKATMLTQGRGIAANYDKSLTAVDLFERMVDKHPQRDALRYGSESINYQQLDAKANQLANHIIAQGVECDLIGICLPPSIDAVMAMLACLKAGFGYLPLDPTLPRQRIEYILEDANCALVISDENGVGYCDGSSAALVNLPKCDWQQQSAQRPNVDVKADDLAYCIYTSGSTGLPKGVLIEHGNLARLLVHDQLQFEFNEFDVWTVFHNLNFDFSVWEIYGALFYGGCAIIVSKDHKRDPKLLRQLLLEEKVTVLNLTPSAFYNLSRDYLAKDAVDLAIRYVIFGGEALNPIQLKPWALRHPETEFVNMYGITETTVHVSHKIITLADMESLTSVIGRPIPTTDWYIFDEQQRPVPLGVPGELYIGGAGVARGYLNRPELSAERFLYCDVLPNERLYRTGDKAKFCENGEVIYLGRLDHQIQIRGFRVELGEIQSQLLKMPQIKDAVVIATDQYAEQKEILAYLVAQSEFEDKLLRAELVKYLPEYMIPAVFISLDELPLTVNGKLDSSRLPDPARWRQSATEYVAPTTESEKVIAQIWQDKLNLPKVGVNDNFFELGGHSLLATSITAAILAQLDVEVPIRLFFENPNIGYLAHWVEQQKASGQSTDTAAPLVAITPTNTMPLSFSQQRLWFIDNLQSGSSEYHMPLALKVTGSIDLTLVKQVFDTILSRHQVLRSVYPATNSQNNETPTLTLRSMAEVDFNIAVSDLTHLTGEQLNLELNTKVSNDIAKPFDLTTDLMLRVSYYQTAIDAGLIVFNMHHIASDGWSMAVLAKEFFTLYQAYSQGLANPLPPLEVQYSDYADWQRAHLSGEVLKAQRAFWQQQLEDLPVVHSLPLDYPRPAVKQHRGAIVHGQLSGDIAKSLLNLTKTYKLTPFMLVHGALALLLSRHSNSHDIVIGTPIANRLQQQLEPLIGFFVNTLVLRANTNHDDLAAYFDDIRQLHADVQSHQTLPFEQVVDLVKVERSTAHTPLFQIMLTTNNDYGISTNSSIPGLTVEHYSNGQVQEKFDLSIDVSISEREVNISWNYDVSLFSKAHIEQLNAHFCCLLESLSQIEADQTVALSQIAILSADEQQHLLYGLNDTIADYDQTLCLHQLVEQQVQLRPDHIALQAEQHTLSYQQLNAKANQLANYLRKQHGVKPETVVGLCVERSLEMIIGLLGILKAGGAYLPIDPELPQDRVNYMLKDANVDVVVSQSGLQPLFGSSHVQSHEQYQGTVITLDDFAPLENYCTQNPQDTGITSNHLAYVIYTSGSTGKPKGVMVEHQGVVNKIIWRNKQYGMSHNDKLLQKTPCSFDVSVWEFIWPLAYGGRLVMAKPQGHKDPQYLCQIIQQQQISKIHFVPSMLGVILQEPEFANCDSIQQLFCSGEALQRSQVEEFRRLLPQAQLHNLYGPTEASIEVSYWDGRNDVSHGVPIGQPIDNVQLLILDDKLNLVPQGAVGELHIGGDCLARGYLNLENLSAERFINNPYYNPDKRNSSKRLYKTGDLARIRPDGDIEYQGRTDFQVKIRGLRIELGEIEHQMSGLSQVDSALVTVAELGGSTQLLAYVKTTASIDTIKQQLRDTLPAHMVPEIIIAIEQWPVTANGKVDRKALPQPDASQLQLEQYIAPSTATEQLLVDIWAEILQIPRDQIGIKANFFTLGGHSLLIMRLAAQIRQQAKVDISMQQIFECAKLDDLAKAIDNAKPATQTWTITAHPHSDEPQPLSFAQQRLWFINSLQQGSSEYHMPLALKVKGTVDLAIIKRVFETIISRHQVLRSVYPSAYSSQNSKEAEQATQRLIKMEDIDFTIGNLDLTHLSGEQLSSELKRVLTNALLKPFDLSCDLMLRVSYFKTTGDTGVFLFNMHHIASDGWSMAVLAKEFFALYQAYTQGKDNPLPDLAVQYSDYARWQHQHLTGEVLKAQRDYWQQQLDELPVVHTLPLDFARPTVKQYQGALVHGKLNSDVAKSLLTMASNHQLTPFMLVHSALALVLSRHSNSYDIVIGTPVANRLQQQVEPLIGFFVNTLVLRANTSHHNLADYFSHIRQIHADAQSHQDLPFEQVVDLVKVERSTAHTPLFQIMLTTNNDYDVFEGDSGSQSLSGLEITPFDVGEVQEKFDLSIDIALTEHGVDLNWSYDVSLFTDAHIKQLNDHLSLLLENLTQVDAQSESSFNQIAILSADEQQHLLYGLNDTIADYDQTLCLHQLVEQQVQLRPDHIALQAEQHTLSYQQLNAKANQLANYLRKQHGVKPETVVGLCVERSLEMIIGLLGILKAGGAYLPIDPELPQDRVNYMLKDANVDVVVSQSGLQPLFGSSHVQSHEQYQGTVITLDDFAPLENYCTQNPQDTGITSNHLAYVIYTSGSTGKPKGVMVEHQGVVNKIIWRNKQYGMSHNDKLLQKTPCSFDVSVWEFIWPLAYGGRLVMAKPQGHKDPQYLCQIIQQQQISKIHFVPSMLGVILQEPEFANCDSIQQLFCSGEALQRSQVEEFRRLLPQAQLHNLYGPTEASIEVSYWDGRNDVSHGVPIGQPIDNVQLLILDDKLNLVPQGAVGELHIGGDCLARGYLNLENLSAERFINNPYYNPDKRNSSKRLYKTGDLARIRPDGDIEYQGRTDFQVKIRGLRIELGEIEHQMSGLSQVDSALVTVAELGGSTQLLAYVKTTASIDTIKQQLRDTLPAHMVPEIIIAIEQWPVTANGKVDRKALPQPDASQLQLEQYIAPSTATEQLLVDIWAEILQIPRDQIGIKANFFTLGGHSLLIMRLAAQIRQQAKVDISMQQIFECAKLDDLAKAIDNAKPATQTWTITAHPHSDEPQPLSFAQQRLWFINSLQQGSSEYHMPLALKVKGTVDLAIIKRVFETIISRHQVLRSVYPSAYSSQNSKEAEQATQRLIKMEDIDFTIGNLDLTHLSGEQLSSELKRVLTNALLKPFDLSCDLMLRVSYFKTTGDTGVFLFNMHHIASDGWSMAVLAKEFFALYQAYTQGKDNPLPDLAVQYSDYARWQHQHLTGEVLKAQRDYWQQQLDELPVVHTLPLDFARPTVKQYQGALVHGKLNSDVAKSLLTMASNHQLTPFMLVHSALALVLSRHSNSYDIVIGTPVANRLQQQVEPLIGFFVNTLVLRANTSHHNLADYFSHIRQIHADAQSHQDLPFEQVVDLVKVERSTAHTPLFQIMLTTNNDYDVFEGDSGSQSLSGLEITPFDVGEVQEKFDLSIDIALTEHGVDLNWSYDVSLFSEGHIAQLNGHLCRLLTGLSDAQASQSPHALPLLSSEEIHYLVHDLNDTAMAYPKETCIHALFEQQAEERPDNVAVVFEDKQLTYRQLNEKANQLAHYLREVHRVTPDTLVGLCVERSLEIVIGILGILKAGGAYVPLDPSYPQERLNYIVKDAGLEVILSQSQVQDMLASLSHFGGQVVLLDGLAEAGPHLCSGYLQENIYAVDIGLNASNLAYVIYTSGSTGKPKGVLVEHQNVNALAAEMSHWFVGKSRVGWCANYVFDASIQGIIYLFSGRTLVVIPDHLKVHSQQLKTYLTEQQVELLDCTPSLLQFWLNGWGTYTPPSLLVGGEAIPNDLWQALNALAESGVEIFNVYGPTECTVNSTVTKVMGSFAHIGKPVRYAQAYILSSDERTMVPFGVVGELYLGGDGLARGYLNRTELTAECFIDNPFYDDAHPHSSACLYKTGDLVRYLPDGNLEYVGRTDFQVKIRGLRIELGEIEHQMLTHPAISHAVVLVKQKANGDQYLAAYVVLTAAQQAQCQSPQHRQEMTEKLRLSLSDKLADYMIPQAFVWMESLPLTVNGKVDHRALPEPDLATNQSGYLAPTNQTEQRLCDIWQQVLDIEKVGISDNFFTLGGHSLLLNNLLNRINHEFDAHLGLRELFELQTVAGMARLLANPSALHHQQQTLVLLRDGDPNHTPWYFIHPLGASVSCYLPLAAKLNHQGPIYALQKVQSGQQTIEQMASDYITLIEEQQGALPQQLFGWSFGGVVGYEMACQLEAKGHAVTLTMIDSFNPQVQAADSKLSEQEQQVKLLWMMLTELGVDTSQVPQSVLRQPLSDLLPQALQLGQNQGVFTPSQQVDDLTAAYELLAQNDSASARYQPTTCDAKVLLLKAAEGEEIPDNGWQAKAHQLTVSTVAGDHFALLQPDSVEPLAREINQQFAQSSKE